MDYVDYFLTLTYFAILSAFLIEDDQYAKYRSTDLFKIFQDYYLFIIVPCPYYRDYFGFSYLL